MNTHSTTTGTLVHTSIIRDGEKLAVLSLTIQTKLVNSLTREALCLVYEDALLAGAGSFTREAFHDALSLLGSDIAVHADSGALRITVRTRDESLPKTLKLLEVMLTAPTFATKEIKRIKERITNELILLKEDARMRAYRDFAATLTHPDDTRHPYPIDDIARSLPAISARDMHTFHDTIRSSAWLTTAGGNTKSCTLMHTAIERIAKALSVHHTAHEEEIVHAVAPHERVLHLTDIPNKQNIEFSIGNALPLLRGDDDFPAFVFGLAVCAIPGSFAGRLMSTVREKEGLTYDICGNPERVSKTEEGFWRIRTFFNPKDAVRGIESTLREINRMHAKGITDDELIRFKKILNTRYALIEDSLVKKVGESHALKEGGMSEDEYAQFKHAITHLTTKQVNAAMKKYLSTDSIIISGAGPIAHVKKDLENLFSPDVRHRTSNMKVGKRK